MRGRHGETLELGVLSSDKALDFWRSWELILALRAPGLVTFDSKGLEIE